MTSKSIPTTIVDNYHNTLMSNAERLRSFQTEQGFTLETIKKFKIGFDSKRDWITIPHLFEGNCVSMRLYASWKTSKYKAYTGQNGEKYTGKFLLGCDEIDNSDQVLICAGEKDRMMAIQNGFCAVCCTTGEGAWDDDWTCLFKDKDVLLMFDNDKPGRDGAKKIAKKLCQVANAKIVDLSNVCTQEKEDLQDFFVKYKKKPSDLEVIIEDTKYYSQEFSETSFDNSSTDAELFPPLPFPFDIFPEQLISIINDYSKAHQLTQEDVAFTMLPIISGAIGNTIKVSPKKNWIIPLFVWSIFIKESGYGQSPLQNALMKPINELQSIDYKEYMKKKEGYDVEIKKQKKQNLEDIATISKPKLNHYLASDITVESLADIFESTPRGVILHKDELAGLILGLNQYKSKGGNDRQHILELFNCGSWKIDRKTGSRFIQNTGASILGGIQPKKMTEVFGTDAFDDGLLPRFIMLLTEPRRAKFSAYSISNETLNSWKDLISSCYNIELDMKENGFVDSKIIQLNNEAIQCYCEFHDKYSMAEQFLSNKARPFIPKMREYSLKFAGIIQIIDSNINNEDIPPVINKKVMEDAIKLTNYFMGQVIKVVSFYDDSSVNKDQCDEFQKQLIRTLYCKDPQLSTS